MSSSFAHFSASSGALISVDRVISDLRRGLAIRLTASSGAVLKVYAAEYTTPERLSAMIEAGHAPRLALTKRRASWFKRLRPLTGDPVLLPLGAPALDAATIAALADPTADFDLPLRGPFALERRAPTASEQAAVKLMKLARLLPAALIEDLTDEGQTRKERAGKDLLTVDAEDVAHYEVEAAIGLRLVSEARVPLANAENARILAFRPANGGIEHLAIVIGDPPQQEPVLARIHSECFTGDLLGSLRCDCGEQLRGAIRAIATAGNGIVLYLSQEGRGIGLVNKLKAYRLQDQGLDTVEANERLGFEPDERVFLAAAEMLHRMGFSAVRLLTNNPEKVAALGRHGIVVVERVPHAFPSNDYNAAYLATKKEKSGHLL